MPYSPGSSLELTRVFHRLTPVPVKISGRAIASFIACVAPTVWAHQLPPAAGQAARAANQAAQALLAAWVGANDWPCSAPTL